MSSKFAEQLGDLEKRYFLFRRQLKTFLDALRFFRENTNQAQGQLRTVREMEGLLNGAGQANATYKGAVKLWFEVYDELRSVIQNQLVAAQACAPEVTDEVLKIRVAEALEYVNEITQPDYDVVENELEKRIQEDLHDMRHDELFQMNFSDRRMFGSMVAMLPLAFHAARKSHLVCELQNWKAPPEIKPRTPYNNWQHEDWRRKLLKTPVKRSVITPPTWYGPSRDDSAKIRPTEYKPLRPASGMGYTRKL
ncbi:uncharacterized protein LOC134839065 isoform X1 [Symsagittifera roscoffensis]|uniref:uncharacterized protein LOC134839065 isoform X1 n=1 Tax=Symsagittifera roscoffensis TaxID=84072 RepID=UPI00307B4D53